ncbi:unnamed protein product [Lymnaea stagnalis]|uniref:Uncharacterized protein n=1 Tax=Lymnaea stagnalis TaxID=6523 RepID=A0AAV2I287_LYMST
MVFEAGPFSYFGKEALNLIRKQSILNDIKVKDYVPDFSLRALTDLQYLCINRALYLAALRTTRMLRNSGNIPVNEAFDAEFEKVTKLNSNRNSGFESHFVLGNTALELLKNDHQGAKKRSTSSLDRLTFLHHSLGALYHHSSQNAKDNSVEYHGEVGPEGKPLFPNVRASKSSGDGDSKSRHTPESKKKTLFSSLPFSSSSNKMYFHREAGESEPELKKKDLSIAVPTGADRKPPGVDHVPQDALSSVVIMSDTSELQTNSSFSESESKPLIHKPVADTGKGATSSPAPYNKGQDAEMVPLMNQTESTFDISVNSASV